MAARPAPTCPVCGAPGRPIAYGYPSSELFDAADRGEVVLGGCTVSDEAPTHGCPDGHRWRVEPRSQG